MQRRTFLKDSILGFSALLMTPTLLAVACTKEEEIIPNGKTVVVVGAGLAGLAAANKLQRKGFTVIVLEAQDAVGGRIRTNRSLAIPFDTGASWIHGIKGNPITNLAKKAGMKTSLTDDDSLVTYDLGGLRYAESAIDNAEKELQSILSTLKQTGKPNQSFAEVFKTLHPDKYTNRLWQFLLSSNITFDLGDLDRVSSTLYDEGEVYSGAEHVATNGYDTIANYLAKGLDIRFDERVSAIDYSGSEVQVTHTSAITRADFVLVTVPLGVLKAGNIQFTPNLPTVKQQAITGVGMGCVNKFLCVFDRAFWDDTQYIAYTPSVPDRFNYFLNLRKQFPQHNALMTFAYAEAARQTETMSDQEVIADIMRHLEDIYGSQIPRPTQFLRTKWQTNPNAFGSYTYTAVGTEMQHFDDLARDLDQKVFFGGEHTHKAYFSTAHGAYLSGLREAEKIIDLV